MSTSWQMCSRPRTGLFHFRIAVASAPLTATPEPSPHGMGAPVSMHGRGSANYSVEQAIRPAAEAMREVPDVTPEQEAMLRDVQVQLRGPGLAGWPQLGDDDGTDGGAISERTVVEALGAALRQIGELRTEIADLETTVLELTGQTPPPAELPWPLSLAAALLENPAAVIGEQIARWESLLDALRPKPDEAPQPGQRALEAPPSSERQG